MGGGVQKEIRASGRDKGGERKELWNEGFLARILYILFHTYGIEELMMKQWMRKRKRKSIIKSIWLLLEH